MPCEECKKMDDIQELANKIVSLSEDEVVNLNCLIAGNKLEIVNV